MLTVDVGPEGLSYGIMPLIETPAVREAHEGPTSMGQAPKGHLHAEIPSFQSVIISVSPREVARLGAQSTSLMTGSNSLGPFRGPLPAREKRVTSRGWLTLLTSHEPCSGTVILLMSAWFMRGEKGAPSGACTVMRVRF